MTYRNLELKPCLHCGGKGDYYSYHPSDTRFEFGVVAQCAECGYEHVATVFGSGHDDEVFDALLKHVVDEWNVVWEKENKGELKMINKIKTMVEREIDNAEKKIKQYRSEQISDVHNEHDLSVANGVLIIGKYNGYKEALHVVRSYIESLNIKKASDQ